MPPKPCPFYLKILMKDANERPSPNHPLRQILQAVQDLKRGKGANTLVVTSVSNITLNLSNFSVTVRTELEPAFREIDSRNIHLIRECLKCGNLFWAGRIDKRLCDKHAAQWRKTKQRQKQREEQAKAGKEAAEQKHIQAKEELIQRLSLTSVAALDAIVIDGKRTFGEIDRGVWERLKENPLVRRVPSDYVVRRTLNWLVRRGYLSYAERAEHRNDRYSPRQKLLDLW